MELAFKKWFLDSTQEEERTPPTPVELGIIIFILSGFIGIIIGIGMLIEA